MCENMKLIFTITLQDEELEGETASVSLAVTIRGALSKTQQLASNSGLCHASQAQPLEPSPGFLIPSLMVSCHLDSVETMGTETL